MSFRTDDGWDLVTAEEAEEAGDPVRPRVVIPTEEQYEEALRQYKDPRCCGFCEHFLLRMGQAELESQRVIPTAVQEYDHSLQWYGNQKQFGLCDQWDGHMTSAMGPITIPKHFLDSTAPYETRDKPVECPAYKQRSKGLRSIRHYVGKARNYEE
jgi:hypothetical protein